MRLPRQIKNSLLTLLLIFAAQKMWAQYMTADDFFNSGAQLYISNNVPEALKRTESGLKVFPNDEKLKKLEQLLKQQQQSQSQQNQQQQKQQNQSQQSQQQKQQQKQQPQNQNSQQEQKQQQNEKQQQQQSQARQKSGDEKKSQEKAPAMSPQEAKQLLDSQKNNEQFLSPAPKGKPQDNNRAVKDW